jgi:hypothetical protein
MNLTELSRLAIERGVIIHIGCAGRDKGKTPPVITVQVTDNSPRDPGNFSMEVSALNPGAEDALEFATKRLINDYTGHKSSLRVL